MDPPEPPKRIYRGRKPMEGQATLGGFLGEPEPEPEPNPAAPPVPPKPPPPEAPPDPDWWADRDKTIEERFREFDANNPLVYQHLERLAFEAVDAGMKRIGIRNIWEVMRWHVYMQTRDPSHLKLNDHYHSRYVRKLVRHNPRLENYFELRKLRAP